MASEYVMVRKDSLAAVAAGATDEKTVKRRGDVRSPELPLGRGASSRIMGSGNPSDVIKTQPTLSDAKMLLSARGARAPLKQVRVRIGYSTNIAGVAGAALSTVTAIQPGAATEFATWAGLYDEVYVHGGVCHFDININANSGGRSYGAMVYDPENAGAYTNFVEPLLASQHVGPFALDKGEAANASADPEAMNKTGMWALKFRCPREPQMNPVSAVLATGNWSATSDTSMVYGYLKPFFSAVGATTLSTQLILILDVSFRSRT